MQYDYRAPAALFYSSEEKSEQISTSKTRIPQFIDEAHAKAFNFACVPLTTSAWHERWMQLRHNSTKESPPDVDSWRQNPCFQLNEVNITRLEESENIIAVVSPWIELDSPDHQVRHDSEIALMQEITYAAYLGVPTLMLPIPRNKEFVSCYACSINAALSSGISGSNMHLTVRIRLTDNVIDSWETWDTIRTLCAYHPRLSLTLDFDSPNTLCLPLMSRWISEPARYLFISARCFISNSKGFPVLPKAGQEFIRGIIHQRPTVILAHVDLHLHAQGGEDAYLQYIRHLEKTSPQIEASEIEGTLEHFARGYQDYLQAPLQPLMDNLPSITYEMFEKDPVKYAQYEKAIELAVKDKLAVQERVVICLVGAGRGGILARCFNVKQRTSKEVALYAIEKNPNAFMTLQERNCEEWNGDIKLIFGDMRAIELPEKVDILVSELLGSFGDNELSPECLDGAMRFLGQNGVSIPSSYTAYLTPLSSSKLFSEVHSNPKDDKPAETPYVVLFNAVNILSNDDEGARKQCGGCIQKCWSFDHPNRNITFNSRGLPLSNNHNSRSAILNFHIPHASVLHGLGGYFETVLYSDIGLSIHPQTKDSISPNMLSWFPLFFPLKEPLYIPSNSELHVSIWRRTDIRKVWYEWSAESYLLTPSQTPGDFDIVKVGQTSLHNAGGRSSWIGL